MATGQDPHRPAGEPRRLEDLRPPPVQVVHDDPSNCVRCLGKTTPCPGGLDLANHRGTHRNVGCLQVAVLHGELPQDTDYGELHHHHDSRCGDITTPETVVDEFVTIPETRWAWRNDSMRYEPAFQRLSNGQEVPVANYNKLGQPNWLPPASLTVTPEPTFVDGAFTTLHGENFVIDDSMPFGTVEVGQRRGVSGTTFQAWCASEETIRALSREPGEIRLKKIRNLREAREKGNNVVKGVVSETKRRPATQRVRADLSPLVERAKSLVVQIATVDTWTEAQAIELAKTRADIETELTKVRDQIEEVEDCLGIIRGQITDTLMSA